MEIRNSPFFLSLIIHLFFVLSVYFVSAPQKYPLEEQVVVEIISQKSASQVISQKSNLKKESHNATDHTEPTQTSSKTSSVESEIGNDLVGRLPKNAQEKYLISLRDQIRKFQKYPKPSLVFKEEGFVKVQMTLDRKGHLTNLELVQESPFARLNVAAIKAVADAAPFSEFPDEIGYQTWKVTVPVQFNLSQN